jgi:regulator of protease activity HflC (stomatin/prohibitin superfamily)
MELSSLFNLAVTVAGSAGAIYMGYKTLKSSFFNVQQQQDVLVTRFGKHIRTENDPGLKMRVPFIDKIARVNRAMFQSAEELNTKTKDDLFVALPITVQYEIADSAKFFFKNKDAVANMMKLVSASVRTSTSGKDFQELYTDRDSISTAVIDHIQKDVDDFGISIRRIVIDQPNAPTEVQKAFNEVRASERRKESARNNADAHYIEVVRKAEADKDSLKLAGEGAAQFRKAILDGYKDQIKELTHDGSINQTEALEIVLRAMTLDALRDVGRNGNTVIVPQDFAAGNLASTKALQDLNPNKAANDRKPAVAGPAAPAA